MNYYEQKILIFVFNGNFEILLVKVVQQTFSMGMAMKFGSATNFQKATSSSMAAESIENDYRYSGQMVKAINFQLTSST